MPSRRIQRLGGTRARGDPQSPYPGFTLGNGADVGAVGASKQHLPLRLGEGANQATVHEVIGSCRRRNCPWWEE